MKSWIALLLSALAITGFARAHTANQAAVLLDFHGATIDAELQIPAAKFGGGELLDLRTTSGVPFAKLSTGNAGWSKIDGASYVVIHLRFTAPTGSAELFDLHSSQLQNALVSVRSDWRTATFASEPQLIAVLGEGHSVVRVDRRDGAWWKGFQSVFSLGVKHIAEGTDHLLFLLVLLLPAPLMMTRMTWADGERVSVALWRAGRVVTAFTLGHSLTLAAGATGLVAVPGRLVEVLIAVSILVSAAHAWRPLFPGREPWIACCFGLIHGLAFATALSDLGLGAWERAAGILAFNCGIEAMQLFVILAGMPSLLLLSRTRIYPLVRKTGALLSGFAAAGWIAERLVNAAHPVDDCMAVVAKQAGWIAVGLLGVGVCVWCWERFLVSPFGGTFLDVSRRPQV